MMWFDWFVLGLVFLVGGLCLAALERARRRARAKGEDR
jgi:hypothetical protein